MCKIPKISDSEWEVMKVLWEKQPRTSSEIVEILRGRSSWSPTTIYTLINRLVNKKAISIVEGSSPYICYPLVSQDELRREEHKSFLKKVYDGSLKLLLTSIVEENDLSEEDIEQLKKMLDDKKGKGR